MFDFGYKSAGAEIAKIFLSYDRRDLAIARNVATALEELKHDVWWDRHIRGGAQFSKEIDQALAAAEAVLVLWSERSIDSPWVRDEAAAGRDSGRLIPIAIDGCTPPLGFRQYQIIDLAGFDNGGHAGLQDLDLAIRSIAAFDAGAGLQASKAKLPRQKPVSRRKLLIAGGAASAVVATGGGVFLWERKADSDVPPEVEPLLFQAKQLMDQNTREGQNQAIGLYQRVVETAPDYADGWGWLGFAHGVVSHFRERTEGLAHRAKAEAAGRHALELDPRSAYGELALSIALPFIGHWEERERRLRRALALQPGEDQILLMLAVALLFAGRSTEAVPLFQRIKQRPLTPAAYSNYIRALWGADRLAELDQAIRDAASLYPTQATIWFTRVHIAMYSGQAGAVAALAEDAQTRPSGVSDEDANDLVAVARAIQRGDPRETDRIMAHAKQLAKESAGAALNAIANASALGRVDDAFELAAAYFFGRGFIVPDYSSAPTSFSPEQRQTTRLFEPMTKPMRADRRFEALVKELGLDEYWRKSGKPPDYRHIPGL